METTELRETSYRRIKEVLAACDPDDRLGLKDFLMPIGEWVHYLRCGDGLVMYILPPDRKVANMHGALMPGDGAKAPAAFREHCAYLRALGVERITTRHCTEHRRASLMCRVLGFEPVACDPGHKRYERDI